MNFSPLEKKLLIQLYKKIEQGELDRDYPIQFAFLETIGGLHCVVHSLSSNSRQFNTDYANPSIIDRLVRKGLFYPVGQDAYDLDEMVFEFVENGFQTKAETAPIEDEIN